MSRHTPSYCSNCPYYKEIDRDDWSPGCNYDIVCVKNDIVGYQNLIDYRENGHCNIANEGIPVVEKETLGFELIEESYDKNYNIIIINDCTYENGKIKRPSRYLGSTIFRAFTPKDSVEMTMELKEFAYKVHEILCENVDNIKFYEYTDEVIEDVNKCVNEYIGDDE